MFFLRSLLPCLVGLTALSGSEGLAQSPTGNDPGSVFRYTYPLREEGSSEIYTAPPPGVSPPVSAPDAAVPAPLPGDPLPAEPTGEGGGTSAAAESPSSPEEPAAPTTAAAPGQAPVDIGEGRFSDSSFRFSFALYEGYNSNVTTSSGDNQVESAYTEISAGASYEFGNSRLQLATELSVDLAFYYNNLNLQNDGLFPTVNFTLGANYAATPRFDLSLETYTAYLSQPNFTIAGAPTTYNGDYVISSTTFGLKYLWLPKFATETTYVPILYYYAEEAQNDISGRYEQTISQQFIYLWKPATSLVLEYDFNTRNFYTAKDLDSIGNFLLLGVDHTLNPRSTAAVRAGAEQRFNQNPFGGTDVYLGPFASLNFNYALGRETTIGLASQYGTTASGFSNYTQAQQLIFGLTAAHRFSRRVTANAFLNYQNNFYDQPNSFGAAPDFHDNIFNAGLNASVLVYRSLSVRAGYSFTTLMSTDTTIERDYTQNVLFIGAELDF